MTCRATAHRTLENTKVAFCGYTTEDHHPTTGLRLSQEECNRINSNRASQVARITIEQMGGVGSLKLMLGATSFTSHSDEGRGGVSFRFKGSNRANYVKVVLSAMDTYTLRFGKVGKYHFDIIDFVEDVYNDQLDEVFYRVTGLEIKLPRIHVMENK
jgi:hypothetical protein